MTTDFDAIVIGGGHNGLTAAAILQRGGARTLVLEKNHYTGGMASTVELFDGFRFEIAGSVLFPMPPVDLRRPRPGARAPRSTPRSCR